MLIGRDTPEMPDTNPPDLVPYGAGTGIAGATNCQQIDAHMKSLAESWILDRAPPEMIPRLNEKMPGKILCSKGYLFQKNLQEIYEY